MNPLLALLTNSGRPANPEASEVGDGSKVVVVSVMQARPGPLRPGTYGTMAVCIDQYGQTWTLPWSAMQVLGAAPVDWTPEWLATL